MSGLLPPFAAASASETGRESWSNVEIVACGRHNEGFTSSLKTFRIAEKFIDHIFV